MTCAAPAGASRRWEVYVDPYRGTILLVRDLHWDPLGVLLRLHQSLLLPPEIGRRVVGVAVLVFVPSLLTGAVLWLRGGRAACCGREPRDDGSRSAWVAAWLASATTCIACSAATRSSSP